MAIKHEHNLVMPALQRLRLGTRSSNLAVTQSRHIAKLLTRAHPKLRIELVEIQTTGDTILDKSLQSFGGTGVFVKELENALMDGRIDLAVHSLKDLPTRQPAALVVAAVPRREDPRDVAVLKKARKLSELPPGSVIGTGSLRRQAQLKRRYPHLEFAEIRGNVETRIRKVAEGQYNGTILARAGLRRLGLMKKVTQALPLSVMLPAPGQGALAVECRVGDKQLRKMIHTIHDSKVEWCVRAERVLLEALGGGCHLPLGALGQIEGNVLRLRAFLGLPDGSLFVKAEATAAPDAASRLGKKVAGMLLASGGKEILEKLK